MSLDRQDAVQSGKACSPKKIEKESLGGVVAMVGGEDGSVMVLL